VKRRQTSAPTAYPAGSIGDLVARYRKSDEFTRLSEGTQSNYEVTMRRFEDAETWGLVPVKELIPLAVQTARDAMKETPVMANQMLSVGRTIWDWAIPLDLAQANPFDKVVSPEGPTRLSTPAYAQTEISVRRENLGLMSGCRRPHLSWRYTGLLLGGEWRAEVRKIGSNPGPVRGDAVRQRHVTRHGDDDVHHVVTERTAVEAGKIERRVGAQFVRQHDRTKQTSYPTAILGGVQGRTGQAADLSSELSQGLP
jgi:hypothetical protein